MWRQFHVLSAIKQAGPPEHMGTIGICPNQNLKRKLASLVIVFWRKVLILIVLPPFNKLITWQKNDDITVSFIKKRPESFVKIFCRFVNSKFVKRRRKDINFRWLFLVFLGFWAEKPKNTTQSFRCLFGVFWIEFWRWGG